MNECRQFIDTAYGSSLECAACLDVLGILDCLPASTVHEGKGHLSTLVSMLIGFRKSTGREVREGGAAYATAGSKGNRVRFDHEKLDVYHKALEFVAWCGQLRRGKIAGQDRKHRTRTLTRTRESPLHSQARRRVS